MLYKSEDLLPHYQLYFNHALFKGWWGAGEGIQVNDLPSKTEPGTV